MTDRKWLSVTELAAREKVSTQTVLRWIYRGVFKPEDVQRARSRGRQGWRYVICVDAPLNLAESAAPTAEPVAPDPVAMTPDEPVIGDFIVSAESVVMECAECTQWRTAMRGCVKQLLGECECPKCNARCRCVSV